jgi:thiamine-monophosphate kinase
MPIRSFPSEEYRLLDSLNPFLNYRKSSRYPIPIGDDAAIRNCREKETLVLTADSFVENVHFSFASMTDAEVGYKAMAVNLSDCAAMAALPDGALVQIIFPGEIGLRKVSGKIRRIYAGINEACRTWDYPVIGGNLAAGPCWVIDITLIGRTAGNQRLLKRRGAQNNDGLWVTGLPGQSGAGRSCLDKWGSVGRTPLVYRHLVKKHIRPVPRIEIGIGLARCRSVHAAIDISDGVSKECHTLSYENSLGIVISADGAVASGSSVMKKLGDHIQKDWHGWFFNGGEDYELLFAASPAFNPSSLINKFKVSITRIGTFTKSVRGVVVRDCAGSFKHLESGGWDHLKGRRRQGSSNALPL